MKKHGNAEGVTIINKNSANIDDLKWGKADPHARSREDNKNKIS